MPTSKTAGQGGCETAAADTDSHKV